MNGRIKRADSELNKRSLPIIGKIKIGEKKEGANGKEYPVSLDYFKPSGNYENLFWGAYGEKPNKIEIVFISENIEEVCNERFECWDSKGRKTAHGDGEEFYLFNPSSKEYDLKMSKAEAIEKTKGDGQKWSVILTLRFLIPQIRGVMGQWELNTKGAKSSINNLRDTFDSVRNKAGRISGIPFDLLVKKHTSKKPGATSVYPVIDLVPNLSQESLLMLQQFSNQTALDSIGVLTEEKILELSEHKTDNV